MCHCFTRLNDSSIVPPAAYLSHLFLPVADTTPWVLFHATQLDVTDPLAGKSLTLAAAYPLIYSFNQ